MHIRAGYTISYDCPATTPMTLLLSVRPERFRDLVTPQFIEVSAGDGPCGLRLRDHRDAFGNIAHRLVAPPGPISFHTDFVIQDSGLPDEVCLNALQLPVEDLPAEVLMFLAGSRYCETDLLSQLAWSMFGAAAPGWARVQAIVDYVHDHLTFGYQYARQTRTAAEAHTERRGVCRDFAHLAISLCRCMNIPARYCTGYLGDIGVEPIDAAMDFSAWFQVYLGRSWRTFDARHNVPRIGRILMAYGRDAADVAFTTSFGQAKLTHFEVVTEEAEPNDERLLKRG